MPQRPLTVLLLLATCSTPALAQMVMQKANSLPTPVPQAPAIAAPIAAPAIKTPIAAPIAAPAMAPAMVPAAAPKFAPAAVATPMSASLPTRPDKPGPDLTGMAISPTDLKTAVPGSGSSMPQGTPDGRSGGGQFSDVKARMMGVSPNSLKQDGTTVGSGAKKAMTDELGEKGPISGAKYSDTFAGQAINSQQQGGTNNFSGGGRGHASNDSGNTNDAVNEGLKTYGGNPTGDAKADAAELQYAQQVGAESYAATKNSSATERKNYWNAQQIIQQTQAKRERDDAMGSGAGGPTSRQELVTVTRGVGATTGGAGGAGDGRTDQQASGGSGGGVMVLNKTDAPEKEKGVGTLNMDAVLKINTQVNPGTAN